MKMQRIRSFSINHDILKKGMYVSRVDGDVVTYDIRMKEPNKGDYLSNGAMHTDRAPVCNLCEKYKVFQ